MKMKLEAVRSGFLTFGALNAPPKVVLQKKKLFLFKIEEPFKETLKCSQDHRSSRDALETCTNF